MNSDKITLKNMIPVGELATAAETPLLEIHIEVGEAADAETDEVTYTLHTDVTTGLSFVVHVPTGNRWLPTWRSLVSRAELEGIREPIPPKKLEVGPDRN